MPTDRVTTSLSPDTSLLLDGAVEAGLYTNNGDGIRSALREFFEENPEVATKSAMAMYDEGKVDLIAAARLAGRSPSDMWTLLAEEGLIDSEHA